jgi:hypothetical protein
MIRHRFVNDGLSPIPMGATAEYACICGRRGSRRAIERHIAENSADDDEESTPVDYAAIVVNRPPTDDGDFGGGDTKAHYLPIAPRAPASPAPSVDDRPTPPDLPRPLSIFPPSIDDACPICRTGARVADLPEIAVWSCGHWIRRKPQPIAESFQDMLRTAFQAGVAAAASGEVFEIWYQREVLQ